MATGGLYGSTSTGTVAPQSGSESVGLYGNNTVFGGTYFEWFIFKEAATQPATPTGGSWNFATNVGTAPTGWLSVPPAVPSNQVWVSIGVVNSKSTAAISWSAPGLFTFGNGTVTNVSALTIGTAGFDVSSTVANPTTTPVITLNLPTASASNRGLLSAADWTAFNAKQPSGTYVSSVTGTTGRITSTGGTTPIIDLASGIATAGTTGSATLIPVVTIDTYGRVTGITTAANPQGTVTSVAATVPSFLSISGSPITTSGTLAIGYSGTPLPVANGGTGAITLTGYVYGNGTGAMTASTTIPTTVLSGTVTNAQLTNSSITINGNVVSLGGSTTITAATISTLTIGTGLSGTSFNGSTPVTIALATGYGDTLNPYASKTANYVLAAPNGSAGVPTFRAIVAADIPTLNQNTTGTAANITASSNSTITTLSALSLPYSQLSGTVPTWNQNTTGTAANITATSNSTLTTLSSLSLLGSQVSGNISGNSTNVTGTVAIANGGTGQTTAAAAITALSGTQTSGYYLRSNGTNTLLAAIVAGDVPTLNQNTTGTAANITASSNSTLTTLSSLSLPGSQVSGNISGNAANVTGVVAVVNGGSGVSVSSGANSIVLRDANANITVNSINESFSSVAAAGTTTVLIASSAPNYVVTGSGGQTYQLPDATTLANGINYTFNNNQSSGTIVVKNNSSTTVATVQSGGFVEVILLSNATAAGSWDLHNFAPSNVSWSTNTFDYSGSITSATWNGTAVAINRGGTGQTTASAAFNALSPITSTGDLILGNGTNSATRLGIGANGYVLTSNGTTASWAAATGGVSQIVAGTNVTISPSGGTGVVTINATGGGGSSAYTRTTFTATAGQTAFTVTYAVGYLQVYVNGVLLTGSDYTATSGTGFTLNVACTVGDIVEALVITTSVTGITTGKSIAMALIFGY
jgi:hypothetical protein